MKPFTVIDPITITDSNLIASNILEDDAPLFMANEDYLLGEMVISDHKVYEALTDVDSNVAYVRRFKPTGLKASEPTKAAMTRASDLAIAVMPNGDYAAVWIEISTSQPMIQRFNSSGVAQGNPIVVNVVQATHISAVGLVDNQIVVAYRFVTGNQNGIAFARLNAQGVTQQTLNIVTTNTATINYNSVGVGRLPNGNFVVAYTSATGNVTAFAQYTAAGAISGAVTSIVAANGNYIAVAGQDNGNFAITYTNAANQPVRVVYTGANAVSVAAATVAAVTATYTSVASLPNSEFVVVYIDGTNGSSVRFARYNSAGALQGAVTVVSAVASTYSKVAFANTQFVVSYYENVTKLPRFARYNLTGVLHGAITTIADTQVSAVRVGGAPNGQVVFVYADSLSADPMRAENFTAWVDTGPTNRFKALDLSGGTVTTGITSIQYQISAPAAQAVALLDVEGERVRILGTSLMNGTFYDQTFELPDQALVVDWQTYFDLPIERKRELIVTEIPRIADAVFTVTVMGQIGAEVKVGSLIIGSYEFFNFVEYGATAGIIDFSKKETNQFGQTTLVERAFKKRADVRLILDRDQVDIIQRKLAERRAKIALYVAAPDEYEALTILGFYREFSLDIAFPTISYCSLQLEGVI